MNICKYKKIVYEDVQWVQINILKIKNIVFKENAKLFN